MGVQVPLSLSPLPAPTPRGLCTAPSPGFQQPAPPQMAWNGCEVILGAGGSLGPFPRVLAGALEASKGQPEREGACGSCGDIAWCLGERRPGAGGSLAVLGPDQLIPHQLALPWGECWRLFMQPQPVPSQMWPQLTSTTSPHTTPALPSHGLAPQAS